MPPLAMPFAAVGYKNRLSRRMARLRLTGEVKNDDEEDKLEEGKDGRGVRRIG